MSVQREDLSVLTASADHACHAALRDVVAALEDGVWAPLTETVRTARATHQQAVADARFSEDCPEDSADARDRAGAYAVAVAEEVLGPLLEGLKTYAPCSAVTGAFASAAKGSRSSCAALPGAVEVERRREDLVAGPEDGWRRGAGRRLARLMRGVGMGGETRTVDVRSVAQRHRHLRVEAAEARLRSMALRDWAGWLGRMEVGWTGWMTSVLPTLTSGGSDPQAPATELWQVLGNAAAELDEALGALLEAPPHAGMATDLEAHVERLTAHLVSDLQVAGTFLLDPSVRRKPSRPTAQDSGWVQWQDQALARLELHRALLSVYVTGQRTCSELRGRLDGEALTTWQDSVSACGDSLRAGAATVRERSTSQALLDDVRAESQRAMEAVMAACPSTAALEASARRAGGLTVGALQGSLRTVPEAVVVHALPTTPPRRPSGTAQTVALQEMARQAFDALRMERIRKAPAAIAGAVEPMAAGLKDVSEIVSFGFDAAGAELAGEAEDARLRARELVADGLERAAGAVEAVPEPLSRAIGEVHHAVTDEVLKGAAGLASRALAHRMQGQLMDAPSRLAGALNALRRRFGPGFRKASQRLRLFGLIVRRAVSRLMRRGRSLVGAEGGEPSAAARTARSLALADQMVESLPLVYQHLFSADPVKDPALLAGRDVQLAEAERRWRRWREGKGIPFLVTGRRGCGISSFFNVFLGALEEDVEVAHPVLDHRIGDEAALARYLAEILGLDEGTTLDGLASQILEAPQGSVPDLVALEGLEHVYLRVPGGTDLLERLFTLMAETEPRIFWMGSLTSSAWQVVRKAEPAAAAQLDWMELPPLPVEDLRAALMHRHRRSGLNVVFREPAEGRRLLRRRLRALRGTERHQELLRTDYFERLHRSAQGNLRLAGFLWMRSVDFARADGDLVVEPLAPLDWSFLESLDLTQRFTIKAFLEHNTLTLSEHDAVFRITRQESYQIFESLLNRQLIEVVEAAGEEDPTVSRVVAEARYRLRSLIAGALATHLASKNIVH